MGTRHRSARRAAVLAIDGGNSKADVALVDRTGRILGAARRRGRANIGHSVGLEVVTSAVRAACARAEIPAGPHPVAAVGAYCLAGADLAIDHRRIEPALEALGWAERTVLRNDTFAVLRAGTERGWGVAVVCGAGMNCLGVAPDGRVGRFPALGPLSGDLAAGGEWMGLAALAAAIRARDGRGAHTELERAVPASFGMSRPEAVMLAVHRGQLAPSRLMELPPTVFRAAGGGDAVAQGIVDALADEVVVMAVAMIRRLRLARSDLDVVLGGGIFRAREASFHRRVVDGIHGVAPRANVVRLHELPLVGAVLMGLDETGVTRPGRDSRRLRASLSGALHRIERRTTVHSRVGTGSSREA